jgi:hypothetical protein
MILYLGQTINPVSSFKKKLFILHKNYPNTDLFAMGFPPDWESELLWQKKKRFIFF